jgi:hypothetical protein
MRSFRLTSDSAVIALPLASSQAIANQGGSGAPDGSCPR